MCETTFHFHALYGDIWEMNHLQNLQQKSEWINLTNFRLKPEYLPCEQLLQRFEISRTFLRAKHVREKRGKFQLVVEIAYKAVILILLSL